MNAIRHSHTCLMGRHNPPPTQFLVDPEAPYHSKENPYRKTCFSCRQKAKERVPLAAIDPNGQPAKRKVGRPRKNPQPADESPLKRQRTGGNYISIQPSLPDPPSQPVRMRPQRTERERRNREWNRNRGHSVTPTPPSPRPSMFRMSPRSQRGVRSPNNLRRSRHVPRHSTPTPQPTPQAPQEPPYLPPEQWQMAQRFHHALNTKRMYYCKRCKEKWWDVCLREDDICSVCHQKDKPQPDNPDPTWLYSKRNHADPGPAIPEGSNLKPLTMMEECIIARAHVHMQLKRVRGLQYKYTGQCVAFATNTAKFYDSLPLLPRDTDILIMRPPESNGQERYDRQFRDDFRVRRAVVYDWLSWLKSHNREYHDISINHDNLHQLPVDGDVQDQVATVIDDTTESNDEQFDEGSPYGSDPELNINAEGMVPNIAAEQSERDLMLNELRSRAHPAPSVRATPISEHEGHRLFVLAFPSLFPHGWADWAEVRERDLTLSEWTKHLMRWHDGRFARHPKFRFYAYNRILRERARNTSAFFVNRNHDARNLTAEELEEMVLDQGDDMLPRIVRYSHVLSGTRQFWVKKGTELKVYGKGIRDASPLFITLSCADHQWYDLMKHMPKYQEWLAASDADRLTLVRESIQNNPHIIAGWLDIRFQLFKEHILKPHFGHDDFWYRYEWQSRGSGHIHMFIWIKHEKGCPPMTDDPLLHPAQAAYWGQFITAVNPHPGRQPDGGILPCARPWNEVPNTSDFCASCLYTFQIHKGCPRPVCQRLNKETGEKECRFYYPRKHFDEPCITKEIDRKSYRFAPVRNQPYLNQFSPLMTMSWLANTDVQPATTLKGLQEYLGKYVSKPEKGSKSYKDIAQEIMPHVDGPRPVLSFCARMMNKLIGERDYSAQEVSHVLLGLAQSKGSRGLVSLDCRPEADQNAFVCLDDEGNLARESKNPYKRYKSRLEKSPELASDLRDVSLWDYLQFYDFNTNKRRPRAPPRLVNAYPHYTSEKQDEYQHYCRTKLMLHHPFTDVEELKTDDTGETHVDFGGAYEYCQHHHQHDDYFDDPVYEEDDDEERYAEITPEPEEEVEALDFENYSRMRPRDMEGINANLAGLGDRLCDRLYDWGAHVGRYPVISPSYWKDLKGSHAADTSININTLPKLEDLNEEQRACYDRLVNHYRDTLDGAAPPPLLDNWDGKAGTGKTTTILLASEKVEQMARDEHLPNPILRAAPTGVAAHLFLGRTLHNLLKLPVKNRTMNQSNACIGGLQRFFDGVKYLIVDEKSLVGLRLIALIHQRLCMIFPDTANQVFGGLSVIFVGDFWQLPPVGDMPLYRQNPDRYRRRGQNAETDNIRTKKWDPAQILGNQVYKSLSTTMRLTTVMRQAGEDAESIAFKEALAQLRTYEVTPDSWKLLATRVQNNLSREEVCSFDNAPRLFTTNAAVEEYNYQKLRDLGQPIKKIKAEHVGSGAEKATSDEADNLDKEIPLCIGARVMFLQNLWVENGLVNGAMGTVTDIEWSEGLDPARHPPTMVFVKFDHYTGPAYGHRDDGSVPIFPVCHEFQYGAANCTRTQFPLRVAFAVTVHKCQGQTLAKAVIGLGKKDFAAGLSYVAISRVKNLKDVMFSEAFDLRRLQKERNTAQRERQEDWDYRTSQMPGGRRQGRTT